MARIILLLIAHLGITTILAWFFHDTSPTEIVKQVVYDEPHKVAKYGAGEIWEIAQTTTQVTYTPKKWVWIYFGGGIALLIVLTACAIGKTAVKAKQRFLK